EKRSKKENLYSNNSLRLFIWCKSKGNFYVSYTYDFKYKSENTVTFNLTINQKDGKYRYTITDFKIYNIKTGPKTAQPVETEYQKIKSGSKQEFANKFTEEVNNIIEEMKKYMSSGSSGDKDEW
ncbi:MAG: hypothetical protein K2X86_08720, partial [Cytophagaceae bacterium]|nr:hypothetical protein [Cytophagaceae bacterium]